MQNRQLYRDISLRPKTTQFFIDELPLLFVAITGLVYGGMDDAPLGSIATLFAVLLSLYLAYQLIYLKRIRYHIGSEQLTAAHGVFQRSTGYIELYRVVDFHEHQTLLQQIFGLKTVTVLSMDRTTPKLALIGLPKQTAIVELIRERVEFNKKEKASMRSPIIKILVLPLVLLLTHTAKAQIVTANPLEYVALAEGNELILAKVRDQIDGQKKTALLQNTIAAEFEQMRQWEKKYNSYLKTASGFASSIKACTHLYNDGVRIFITLGKLKNAVSDNPQGIVASISMNNLYIETATELVTVFSLLRDAVAKGGKENMLTGAERSQTLWALNDQLSAFQKKLNLLYLSIRTYTMTDVWNNATAGMLDRNNGEIAQIAMRRWRRAATIR